MPDDRGDSSDSSVTLCVGGRVFRESSSWLASKSTFFRGLLSGRWNGAKKEASIFLDRNPDAFESVLELLRNPQHDFPTELWGHELDFYGVDKPEERPKPAAIRATTTPPNCALDERLATALAGTSEEDRLRIYCDRWYELDPVDPNDKRLPSIFERKTNWILEDRWGHEIREMALIVDVCLDPQIKDLPTEELLQLKGFDRSVGNLFLVVGGFTVWKCEGECLVRHALMNPPDDRLDRQRDSLLGEYAPWRRADGSTIREIRFPLPLWSWALGEEACHPSRLFDEASLTGQSTPFPLQRHLPRMSLLNRWVLSLSADSLKMNPLYSLDRVRLAVQVRTYAEDPFAAHRIEGKILQIPVFSWSTSSLSPRRADDRPVDDGDHWEFLLDARNVSIKPVDKLLLQLRVDDCPVRVERVSCSVRNDEGTDDELYRGTEFEMLREMAHYLDWHPRAPIYGLWIGDLRRDSIESDGFRYLVFRVRSNARPAHNARVSLEVDVCLRTILIHRARICCELKFCC